MPAFDTSAFDFGAFDAPAGVSAIATGPSTFALEISVVNPLVFDSSAGYIKWVSTVIIGANNVSSRLTGQISITGAEDAARVATLSVIPATAAELNAYEGQPITIDLTLFRTGQTSTYRRFTGLVETVEFLPSDRIATISCRDGYQERPAVCASSAEVEALLGGLAYPSALIEWSSDQPNADGYFKKLLETLPGACAIDGNGLWKAIPWNIGAAAATFSAGEVFDQSVTVSRANRSQLPSSIVATLNFRYPRLHAVEKSLSWDSVINERYVVDGVPTLPKSTVMAALQGITEWFIKGTVAIVAPIPGSYPVIVGAQTVYYTVTPENSQTTCKSFTASLYRRWYQQTQTAYRISIDMGGTSDRDDSITETIESTFDAAAWETAKTTESSSGIYYANAPFIPGAPVKTGYEGLPEPWPAANSAVNYAPDIDNAKLQAAIKTVVAKALRRAAAGKRKQSVTFERPFDPRFEVGSVLSINAYGIAATGQVVEFSDTIDHDTGEAVSQFRLACPAGSGSSTGFTASATYPVAVVAHALPNVVLGNHTGASSLTAASPDESTLTGFLFNVIPTGNTYNGTAPVYEPQFRIIMPAIPADVRDPLEITANITAAVNIAGSGIGVTF